MDNCPTLALNGRYFKRLGMAWKMNELQLAALHTAQAGTVVNVTVQWIMGPHGRPSISICGHRRYMQAHINFSRPHKLGAKATCQSPGRVCKAPSCRRTCRLAKLHASCANGHVLRADIISDLAMLCKRLTTSGDLHLLFIGTQAFHHESLAST